jgi:hypothetical protein
MGVVRDSQDLNHLLLKLLKEDYRYIKSLFPNLMTTELRKIQQIIETLNEIERLLNLNKL